MSVQGTVPFKCPLSEQRNVALSKPRGSSWRSHRMRGQGKTFRKVSFPAPPPHPPTPLPSCCHPCNTKESASCRKTKEGNCRRNILQLTLCSGTHRPFGYINYPGKRTARGALSSCGTEGWLGGTHIFTTRQGRWKTVKEGSEHHTHQRTLFSPTFPSWPRRPKTFLLFSLHITSQWFSAITNCSLTIPLVAVHCPMGWPATAGSAFPW